MIFKSWTSIAVCLAVFAKFDSATAQTRDGQKANSIKAINNVSLADVAAGKATIVDLTHVLNEKNAYWPGTGYEPFHLKTIATIEKDGVLSKAFSMP